MKRYFKLSLLAAVFIFLTFMALEVYPYAYRESLSFNLENYPSSIPENINIISLSIYYGDKMLTLQAPEYIVNNRIYLPVNDALRLNNMLDEKISSRTEGNYVNIGGQKIELRNIDEIPYIEMSQLLNAFDLKAEWNYGNSSVKLLKNNRKSSGRQPENGRTALLRLEDIGPGGCYCESIDLIKLRTIADFLYSRGIPFHIAWIPVFSDPKSNYCCNLTAANSLYGCEFIYTLDYLIKSGGIIGLHGYTHQYGSSTSASGYEFYNVFHQSIPFSMRYAKERIEKAVAAADALGITPEFFETPHYASTFYQKSVFEKYFKYMYEPNFKEYYVKGRKNIVRIANGALYIPTPLDYYNKANNIVDKLDTLDAKTLASFFYHPVTEFEYMRISEDGAVEYSEDSPLHKIIRAFEERGYTFGKITDFS